MAGLGGGRLLKTAGALCAIGFISIALIVYGHGEAFRLMAQTEVEPAVYAPLFEQFENGMPLAAVPSMLGRLGLLLAVIGLVRPDSSAARRPAGRRPGGTPGVERRTAEGHWSATRLRHPVRRACLLWQAAGSDRWARTGWLRQLGGRCPFPAKAWFRAHPDCFRPLRRPERDGWGHSRRGVAHPNTSTTR